MKNQALASFEYQERQGAQREYAQLVEVSDAIRFQFPEWLLNAKGGATALRETTTEADPT
ncbi:hypothetical protein HW932_09655 [Allochromatium humboldtianum]|uniref:Uncharacterized protein n=1 Tax=Allochromatium humboldtianum TaxID=504901 RepID=A0A850R874_9GAMM|nr:hypothetical protein [Allochromatium humboldtianum]NVZ09528.1 hypothetical protein [Allochromatium humboldtianum]